MNTGPVSTQLQRKPFAIDASIPRQGIHLPRLARICHAHRWRQLAAPAISGGQVTSDVTGLPGDREYEWQRERFWHPTPLEARRPRN